MNEQIILKGNVVLPENVLKDAFLEVTDGRISNILTRSEGHARKPDYDFSGCLLFPGAIDAHVHAYSSATEQEGLERVTKGAATGGVTTVIDMPYDRPHAITDAQKVRQKVQLIEQEAVVDVALFGTLRKYNGWQEIVPMVRAGVCAFKLSTYESDPERFPEIPDSELVKIFQELQKVDKVAAFHAENGALIDPLIEELYARGKAEPKVHCSSRPQLAETTAVLTLLALAKQFPVRLHIVHLSAPEAYEALRYYRAKGVDVSAETCTQYLTLTEEALDAHRALAKCNPPVRDSATREALWERVMQDEVAFITSDHAPWPLSAKSAPNIFDNASGMPGVELLFPLLFSEGVVKGRLSPSKLSTLLAEGPAKRYGLYPQKGTLRVGSDADITVIDPQKNWIFDAAKSASVAKWSPYQGWQLHGKVVKVFVRGQEVYDGLQIKQQGGFGRFVTPTS